MTFGEKLQKLRKERGWTQEQLAAQISISRQALSKWELGTAVPDTENVVQISKLFQVSTDYLLYDEYESDDDLLAVRVSLLAMLIIGILSSVFQAVYIEPIRDTKGIRATTGLIGFLRLHNLEWLFILLIIMLLGGIATVFYPKIQPLLKIFRKK